MKPSTSRVLALALVFAFLFFLACSAIVSAYSFGHSCLHESCSVCALISSLNGLLEILEISFVTAAIFGAAGIFGIRFCAENALLPLSLFTPVALKVKLSD